MWNKQTHNNMLSKTQFKCSPNPMLETPLMLMNLYYPCHDELSYTIVTGVAQSPLSSHVTGVSHVSP